MIAFAKRNLKLYLRDKSSVLISLLAVFIVIGLYVLFLGDVWTEDLAEFHNAREIMDNWVMAGVLAITSLTTTLGMLGTVVKDKVEMIEKDFYVAPVKRVHIAGGYMLSAYIVGVIMTIIALIVAELYIVGNGGEWLSLFALCKVLLMILLTSFMNTSIVLFLVSLFRSMNAFSTASTIIGTMIGFLTGIYLPIGMFPDAVQWIIKVFPVSHAALVFRNIMMETPMEKAFSGIPDDIVLDIKEHLGIIYQFGKNEASLTTSIFIIIGIAIVFFCLASIHIAKKRK